MVNTLLRCLKRVNILNSEILEEKQNHHSWFLQILEVLYCQKKNGNQNPEESYTKKYQNNVACSYGYKLKCVDNKFSKSFKSYLGGDAVYNFISSIIEERKCCSDVMKKGF